MFDVPPIGPGLEMELNPDFIVIAKMESLRYFMASSLWF
jgi:hypothetical protein